MDVYSQVLTQTRWLPFGATSDHHFGGDQSPLNDADADDDLGSIGELDLDDLGLEEFIDSDKLDSTISGDVGSSSLS